MDVESHPRFTHLAPLLAPTARLNMTRAIKAALANIATHHPALGQHLRATVRTGTYCSYTPDPRLPIDWQL